MAQAAQQPAGRPVVEAPLALLEIQVEMFSGNAVVAAQMAFCLAPKILDPIDVIMAFGKALSVINPMMLKFGNIKLIIGFIAVSIDDTIGLHMLPDEANQRLGSAVDWHRGMHLTGALKQAKGQ